MKTTLVTLAFLFLFAIGCTPTVGVFEKNVSIPGQAWSSTFKPVITFEIKDTGAYYRMFVVLRHTDAYRFKNIWLNIGVQPPGDSIYVNRKNLALATDERGWLGKGMDDLYEHRSLLEEKPRQFSKPGVYTFTLQQIMREDPLQYVMNAGIRLEKVIE
ncbi:MAG: gliding motility lipoprotein GldH [Chitinophagaceae bacterium]|nr:gliding motility lipoprotein GldH [Chitinophagaceae bacterium]